MARDRFSERVAKRKRRITVWVSALVVIAAVFAALAWAAWSTSWLAAKEVRVMGIEHLSEADAVAAAKVPLGTSLVQIDLKHLESGVAELPIVHEVKAAREFPNTVTLTIKERQAVAWIKRGSTPWAVDVTGLDYRPLQSQPKHLPQLKAKRSSSETMKAVAKVAAELAVADPNIFTQVTSISAKSKDSIELNLKGGKTVAWGDAGLTSQKAQTLDALLTVPARHYDVSAPERPTTKE